MNLPTAAVVFVALAFTALVVWVLWPGLRSIDEELPWALSGSY